MDLLQELFVILDEKGFYESPDYERLYRKCEKSQKHISELIGEKDKEKLMNLTDNFLSLAILAREEGFKQGFNTCIQLLLQH